MYQEQTTAFGNWLQEWANDGYFVSKMFQEQVTAIGHWFQEWTEPEQMVLLYSLLKRLTPLQIRLLSRVVEQNVTNCEEVQALELQANNPALISSLLSKRKEIAFPQLLRLLPLLHPGNNEAKTRYLSVIPLMLNHSVETGEHLSEAKQLITYSLIHPAILTEERKQLSPWLQALRTRCNLSSTAPVLPLVDALITQQGWRQQKETTRVRRSNSLTPPVSLCHSSADLWTPQDDLCAKQKPRSFSLSSEHVPPLSPQSSQASSGSGSETQLDESKNANTDLSSPGMRDIATWLKQLRLHKYLWLFNQLTYEEMLNISEEKLEGLGVTKGARHKIIVSIKKLKERPLTLTQLDKDVNRGGNLMTVLEELKAIVCSPIKPTPTNETANKTELDLEEIPSQFTKVLGKVCTHLIVNNGRDEEPVRLSMWLLDRCLAHEAFVPHRRRLEICKQQINSLWQQTHQRQNRWFHHPSTTAHHSLADSSRALRRPASTSYPSRPTYLLGGGLHLSAGDMSNGSSLSLQGPATNGSARDLISCSFPVSPTTLAERRPRPQPGERVDKPNETDINSTLEDLCLSMAEHFLEGVS